METLESYFHNWFGVMFFGVLYSIILLFIPFYKKMGSKPKGTYIVFVLAFAIEMQGIPFSMYVISWFVSNNFPEGFLWGHTLFPYIGYWAKNQRKCLFHLSYKEISLLRQAMVMSGHD